MTDEQARELWADVLRGTPLAPARERELLAFLEANPALRDELVADLQLHRLLAGLGRGERDAEAFHRAFAQALTAQGDATRFLKKVDARIDGESKTARHRRASHRWTRRGAPDVLLPVLAAAGVLLAFVLLFALSSSPPTPSASPKAQAPRRPEIDSPGADREQARRQAEERLARLREEETRAAEARAAAEASQEKDLREKAEAAFAEIRRKRQEQEARLALLREEEKKRGELVRPEPLPVDKPVPAPATLSAVARVETAADASVAGSPLRAGEDLRVGQAVDVGGQGSAVLVYPDGTRLELGPSTEARDFKIEGGKRLVLARGSVRAVVARQPKDQPMVFGTPHGEATVLGTTLRLVVDPDPKKGTRLDVEEGKVRLTDLQRRFADVSAGHFAVVAAGVEPVARRVPRVLLTEDFADLPGVGRRWYAVIGGSPGSVAQGLLEVDLTPRPAAVYGGPGGWHTPGGLRTRRAFDVPLRVSVDVELTQAPQDAEAVLHLRPPSAPADAAADLGYAGRNVIHVVRRRDELGILVENRALLTVVRPWTRGRVERWVLEVDRTSIRWTVDGQELGPVAHGLRITEGFQAGLEGLGKANVPAGTRVRFDNVVIEEAAR